MTAPQQQAERAIEPPAARDFEEEVERVARWFASPRFEGILRLYAPRQVVEQRGAIREDHTIAREAAEAFYSRLRELFAQGRSITTFGPYSPGQAVAMKRAGIEAIYLGGWATSAKGSTSEDPGPDLASYPLSQVPDEAAPIVRALLAADRNQWFDRSRNGAAPEIDYRPFIIADADTGHGGEAHVRNLIRRFVEAGVPGYHIEDQKPGVKKCGHQAGKVLVSTGEQCKRLNAARLQLDVMGVPGIIVARTDAEAATFLESSADERDQPFVLGATNTDLPTYRHGHAAILERVFDLGVDEVRGHLLFGLSERERGEAAAWLERAGIMAIVDERVAGLDRSRAGAIDAMVDAITSEYVDAWQAAAGLKTFAQAVAEAIEFRRSEGDALDMSAEEWTRWAARASHRDARWKAASLDIDVVWDGELPRTAEGYYQIEGGLDFAIARSLAAAPFADMLWMETKTANLDDARRFAEVIHAEHPGKMLAYNLSPSFNWDTTGMTDEEMHDFPDELGKLGFVFNFITYGGHQIDGLAGEEFASALRQDGMLALARLQRKLRLHESPYRTPQALVGGPRADAALMASSGHTATTKAMGKGSTHFQHLVQTEVPPKLLEGWLTAWREHYDLDVPLRVALRPHRAGTELVELQILGGDDALLANVIFAPIKDRRSRNILSVRDQNTFDETLRRKRLMSLIHLFLVHRYRVVSVHYVSPTEDNRYQAQKMKSHGIFEDVHDEVGDMIVAVVDVDRVKVLVDPERPELGELIRKEYPR